ncbi:MAG: lactate racemase domain-containing protein [Syntrophobacteraceae bacterium]
MRGRFFFDRLHGSGVLDAVRTGMSIAIGVGSRGISNQALIIRLLVGAIRERGAAPFIFPAMGSHGGATAEGQKAMLERLCFSEVETDAPIKATMDTVEVGTAENGLTVHMDACAAAADGIVLINRIKPHTSFRGKFESGLMKMIVIGLGKQKGAEMCHNLGMERMPENIEALGRAVIAGGRILFGIALLENAYHETCRVEVIPALRIEAEEAILQTEVRKLQPDLGFSRLDVLVIDEIGKEIAGTGLDTNIAGRYHVRHMTAPGRSVTRLVALDISDASHGNGNGLGICDFTTERAFRKFNFEETYPNSLTTTVPESVKIPMVLKSDRLAIQAAVKTCNIPDPRQVRFARIRNTLEVYQMEISENLAGEARQNPRMEVVGEPYGLTFNSLGNLF